MTRVAVVFGGRSTEHSISCLSAGTVQSALREAGYRGVPVGVTQEGAWVLASEQQSYAINGKTLPAVRGGEQVTISADPAARVWSALTGTGWASTWFSPSCTGRSARTGTVQGLLETAGIPYVGSGVYASAASMDKAQMKTALRGAGLPIADYVVAHAGRPVPEDVLSGSGFPFS